MNKFIPFALAFIVITIMASDALAKKPQKEEVYPIKGYDGIEFRMTFEQVVEHLTKLDVNKDEDGDPDFRRVPTKSQYRYFAKTFRGTKGSYYDSEVNVWFKN